MSSFNKILAVDDDAFNLDIIGSYLEPHGYEVVFAEDGHIALEALEKNPDVSVILLDRMMPTMDGMQVVAELKRKKQFREIPVVMQTAASSSKQVEEGIAAGVYYYLTKPYDEAILLAIVRSAQQDFAGRMEIRQEVLKHKHTMGLMEFGRFHFRTIEETRDLSYFIANCFSDPEATVYGLNELMINAIEHGNLGITYEEKVEHILNGTWQEEVERRLALPEHANKYATLEFQSTDTNLIVTIRDQGPGFEWKNYMELSTERATDPSGRGIAISKMKAFPNLEYKGCGNEVTFSVAKNQ